MSKKSASTRTNKLGELISFLSQREKKYLHQFIKLQEEGKNALMYTELYEKLLPDPFLTDAELKSKFPNAAFNRNIKYNRHYLYDIICRSLVMLYADENPNMKQKVQLGLARIFVKRKLFNHASTLAQQVMKESLEHDLIIHHIEAKTILLGIKSRLFQLEDLGQMLDDLEEIQQWLHQEASFHHQRIVYYELINEERSAVPFTPQRKRELEERFKELLNLKEEDIKTIGGILQLQINTALFYHLTQDYKKSLQMLLRNLAEYEKHPEFMESNLMNYAVVISNVMQIATNGGDKALFTSMIHKAESLPLTDPQVKAFVIQQLFHSQMLFAVKNGWTEQGLLLAKAYADTALPFLETEDRMWLLYCQLLLAWNYFSATYWDECHDMLNRILSKRWKERPDMVAATQVLQCLYHAETKNFGVLPSLVLSTRRSLKKLGYMSKEFSELFVLLLQYEKQTGRQIIMAWRNWLDNYVSMEPNISPIFNLINLKFWVENKIKSRS